MTDKTSAQLEHEAESVRSRMTETAESLQRKLSPGQLVDELSTYFRNSDGKIALHNLKAQVRDNPLPLAMIGAGIAWLLMGNGTNARSLNSRWNGRVSSEPDTFGASGAEVWEGAAGVELPNSGAYESSANSGSSISERVGSASERVGSAYNAAEEAASSAAHSVGESMRNVTHRAGEASGRAQRMLSDTLDREPLILGALGIAVGAAIGAMVPRTRAEEAYLAPYGEKIREKTKQAVEHGMEKTRETASTVLKDKSSEPSPRSDQKKSASHVSTTSAIEQQQDGTSGDLEEPNKPI